MVVLPKVLIQGIRVVLDEFFPVFSIAFFHSFLGYSYIFDSHRLHEMT